MKNKQHSSPVFSFTSGVSSNQALEKWLAFNQSLDQADWVKKMAALQRAAVDEAGALTHWLSDLPPLHISLNYFRLGAVAAAVLGALGMAGALQYSAGQPVNVWLLLAVFAVIPLLMTLLTVGTAFFAKSGSIRSSGAFVEFFAKHLQLENLQAPSAALVQWLKWKLQIFSLAFTAGGLLGFLWLATFQDYTFGWSSTLIRDVQAMVQVFSVFAAPWYWCFPQPNADLIAASQFFRGQDLTNAAELTQWWQVIVLSIISYGLLPRFIVMLWFGHRFKRALVTEIATSASLVRFYSAYRHQRTERPLSVALKADGIRLWDGDLQRTLVVGWQREPIGHKADYVLGKRDWDEDNAWLQVVEPEQEHAILVWVQDEQTPTGELADCLHTLQGSGKVELGVSCLLDAERSANALESWRAFAQKEDITLVQMPGFTA
jgi:hypothetical protein